MEARLLVHPDPSRESVTVGVLFDMDPGWHIYWRNPGETGLATEVRFEAGAAQAGPLHWPAPEVFRESDDLFTTFGYEDRVLLASELRLPRSGPAPERIRAEAEVLACRDECIPASFVLERSLLPPTGEAADQVRALFAASRAALPRRPEELGLALQASSSAAAEGFAGTLAVRCGASGKNCALGDGAARDVEFIPEAHGLKLHAARGAAAHPGGDGFSLSLGGDASGTPGANARVAGVLAFTSAAGERAHVAVDVALAGLIPPPAQAEEPAAADASAPGLLEALLLAFVGGLILNLMPCVLPVLAIKVVSITELAHRDRREVLLHGAAYSGGILLTMGLLATFVVALQAGGQSVGWGFQFQEPLFVAGICTVLVVFALNLFGAFEISFHGGRLATMGHDAAGARRSFFEGLLAVVLATPCSAPFLGTAVGFAFAGGAAVIYTIFLAIGAGLAFPFVLVTLVPAWARFIPRAGGWMLRLRAGLGFALLATVVWLLWILGRTVGVDAQATLLAYLVALAFVAWLYGAAQQAGRNRLGMGLGVVLVAVAIMGVNTVGFAPVNEAAAEGTPGKWQNFDPEAVRDEVDGGRAAFVYFTADWCITCAVNERVVLKDARVEAALEELDVARFKADWTRRDEGIRQELARHGKAGVPMYLVYRSGAPDSPVVLPEVLTVDLLLNALQEAASPRPL